MTDLPPPSQASAAAARPAKALLLCNHAEALSVQCAAAIRNGSSDCLFDLQARKHTIVEELAALLQDLDVASLPELPEAVERLRETLRAEMRTLATAANELHEERSMVNAAQRRLTQARRYDTGAESFVSAGGGQLSASG